MLRQKLFKDFLKSKNNLTIRDQLIEMHLPLVKKIVKQFKYFPKALQREDLGANKRNIIAIQPIATDLIIP
nr:hypothetical protein [Mulberry dwarf phytoplasma]